MFWFHKSGQWLKTKSGPVEYCLHFLTVTDCIYSIGNKCGSAAPCHAPFLVFFKAFAMSCFPRQLQSFPPTNGAGKDQQQVNMTEGCSLSYTLTHALSSSPEENTSLTSHRLEEKSYLSCGRCCRYSLILDGCFQVLRFTASPRSFKNSKKKAGNYVYKGGFLPRWVGSDLFDVPLGNIEGWPECNYSQQRSVDCEDTRKQLASFSCSVQ